jgi:ElaB protein
VESTARDFGSDSRAAGIGARDRVQQMGAAASEEVQNLIADVEDLIDRVGEAADPEVRRLRAKVADAVSSAKQSIAAGAEQVQRQAMDAFDAGDRYVRNQPWEAIGIAALAGVAVGFLVSSARR